MRSEYLQTNPRLLIPLRTKIKHKNEPAPTLTSRTSPSFRCCSPETKKKIKKLKKLTIFLERNWQYFLIARVRVSHLQCGLEIYWYNAFAVNTYPNAGESGADVSGALVRLCFWTSGKLCQAWFTYMMSGEIKMCTDFGMQNGLVPAERVQCLPSHVTCKDNLPRNHTRCRGWQNKNMLLNVTCK